MEKKAPLRIFRAAHAREERTEYEELLYVLSTGKMWFSPQIVTSRPEGREDFHLVYVAEGCLWVQIAGVRREVRQGEMIFFDFGVPHSYGGAQEGVTTYWVHFAGTSAPAFLRDLGWEESDRIALPKEEICPRMETLIEDVERQDRWSQQRGVQILREILLMMGEAKAKQIEPVRNFDDIEEVKWLLRSGAAFDWTVEGLAERCHLSESRFIKKFCAVTGKTPVAFRNEELIRQVQWHLRNTNLSVAKIADGLGGHDPAYLTTLFRKVTGMTPTQWRKEICGGSKKSRRR